ncbi:MAG: tRNA-specific 2-thiouridylase MnmA [Parcubacteria group bacterium GW2011_GWF2_38_8]|nr:MAG: tRNA-specific 2-thiouridylase MnmA [Parcubacteria group bacterium GW2011_GWF2_38_8]
MLKGKKVFVGLSGGVDSAVSAAMLKEQGYEVIGVFIHTWHPNFLECNEEAERRDAMRAAAHLDIPFLTFDFEKEYKKEVADYMISEYKAGRTPNPDVICNKEIKFGAFLKKALSMGADYVATGHYARIQENNDLRSRYLLRGKDAAKDQSYFLYALSEDVLARTLFPIGGMTKQEVRAKARHFNLPNAERPDSQGLCFVGEVSMKDFLARFISVESGPALDMKGRIIGEHEGAALYTIGQRHGFKTEKGESGVQYYVVSIHTKTNTLRVSTRREDAARGDVALEDMHWIGEKPGFPFKCEVEARYREVPARAELFEQDGEMRVRFNEPHIAAPGQSLVIYLGERCLGGGIITQTQDD